MIVSFESLGQNEMVRSIQPVRQNETIGFFEPVVPPPLGEPV